MARTDFMVTTLKNLRDNSLPTQLGEPQRWGGGQLPPLTLRLSETTFPASRRRFGSPLAPAESKPGLKQQLLLIVILSVLCVITYLLISRFVATAVVIKGRSMLPTLQDGDKLILNRLSYIHRSP